MTILLHHFLENSAVHFPDKTAVIHENERATYQQINNKADNLAHFLQYSGVKKGDRVILLFENSIDYIVAYYATLKIGAVAAPINPGSTPDGLRYFLNDLEPSALITNFKTERLLKTTNVDDSTLKLLVIQNPKQKWEDVSIPVSAFQECTSAATYAVSPISIGKEDLAAIIYTSGSTGVPKGVMLSHGNIVSNTHSICEYLSLTQADIQMVVLPFFYVMGKSLLNTLFATGGTIVINNRFLYPATVVNQMVDENVTGFSGVPSTYAYLLNRSPLASLRDKLSSLRFCSQAGGHMALALKRMLRKVLPDHTQVYIMYGATEASARLTYLTPKSFESKTESIGKPISNVSIRILDSEGCEVADGAEGELVASGPNIMQGYWNDTEETARVLSVKGYHTGDIGYRDADGFLFVTGRKDGLIKVGGHRINPVEIEDFLISTEQLIEVAVIGIPDQLLGKKLIALAVPNSEECQSKNLMEKCANALPRHKWPEDILLVKTLPKNANGKVDREKCIELAIKSKGE